MTREENLQTIREACTKANGGNMLFVPFGSHTAVYREARLADVLLAIQKTGQGGYYVDQIGQFYQYNNFSNSEDVHGITLADAKWNLRNDTLDAQSDECLAFLAHLLS